MSVNDDLPFFAAKWSSSGRRWRSGQPLLGICLGAQLIARALGRQVRRNPAKEIGWFDLHFTEAAAARPAVFAGSRTETVFHWHGETFDLPPGAELLAWSEPAAIRHFVSGSNVYGLQFHLEVTPEMIADWCMQDENCGDVRELESAIDPCFNAARMEELSRHGVWAMV